MKFCSYNFKSLILHIYPLQFYMVLIKSPYILRLRNFFLLFEFRKKLVNYIISTIKMLSKIKIRKYLIRNHFLRYYCVRHYYFIINLLVMIKYVLFLNHAGNFWEKQGELCEERRPRAHSVPSHSRLIDLQGHHIRALLYFIFII